MSTSRRAARRMFDDQPLGDAALPLLNGGTHDTAQDRSVIRRMRMARAGDIMHRGAECIREDETLEMAARKMRDLRVGSLPICGGDQRLHGIVTDRDIVIRCIAEGGDPRTTTARELAQGTPVWVDVEAPEDEVLRLMEQHQIRRLPVIENRQLVGMISEADLATHLGEHKVAQYTGRIYSAPPNL
ncbi:CBS domain-containing protein [Micromonospora sp. NPDC047527]|uniref:CBS domain-containing protein n=1 Tax=unclassified Micromonospora TaxID=2617518 RepID=UPI0033CAC2D1